MIVPLGCREVVWCGPYTCILDAKATTLYSSKTCLTPILAPRISDDPIKAIVVLGISVISLVTSPADDRDNMSGLDAREFLDASLVRNE
jgi:hypothetical protein